MHRQIRLVGAVHSDHAEKMRVARRKGAEAHQGQGAGCIGQPHQLGKAGAGLRPRIDQAAAAVEQRPFGGSDHLDGLRDPRRVRHKLRTIAFVAPVLGPAIGAEREQHVLRQIDDDRPRPAAPRDVERLMDYAREIAHVLDQVIVLGARPGDAGGVGLLEGVVADQMRRHLPREAHDRHRVHQRVGQPGHRIRGTRAARHQHDPDPAGRAGIALRGVHRTAFLAHQDVAQRVLLEQRVVDRQDRTTGIAENDIDALVDQRLDDDIRSTPRLGRHNRTPELTRSH